jgi:hypothetical protein
LVSEIKGRRREEDQGAADMFESEKEEIKICENCKMRSFITCTFSKV